MAYSTEALYQLFEQHPILSTDSRQLPAGCLYFALKGARFNGNQFAARALADGAAYAIVDEPIQGTHAEARVIRVPNVLKALQDLARHHRRRFHIPVIAVGGSNGKTTTKELIAAVLSTHHRCHATKGNLNNHIGVPLTLLSMPLDTEVAVIEMGTNQPGDIAELCHIAEPTHGLVTNIGKEHLEKLVDIRGVMREEGALYQYLGDTGGCAFLNADEPYLAGLTRGVRRTVRYQSAREPVPGSGCIQAAMLRAFPGVSAAFAADEGPVVEVHTRLFGQHNFQNVLSAIALGIYFRVPSRKIKSALESYTPSANRSQVLQWGSGTIWLDAYNANPSSMRVALDSLIKGAPARKGALLGDMLEVGASAKSEHQAMVNKAIRAGVRPLGLVGPMFGQCKRPRHVQHFPDAAAASVWLAKLDLRDTLLLIKGSRGIQLEQALPEPLRSGAAKP